MSDDLISRQAAIAFVDCGHLRPPTELAWSDKDVVDMLKRMPSAQPQWIPVTERLPKDQTYVLVSTLDNDVQEAHLDGEGRFRDCYGDKVKCVIAWMPLPEPYEE